MREMAHRVVSDLAHMPRPAAGPDDADDEQNALLADVLERALAAGEAVGRARPRPAAGRCARRASSTPAATALIVLVAGVVAALQGAEPPPLAHHAPARVTHPQHESSTYRYCTNFAVTGSDLDPRHFIARARGARRLGARRRRPHDAEGPRPHRRARAGHGAVRGRRRRSRTSTSPTCTSRSRSRSERLAGDRQRRRRRTVCGAVAVVSRRGMRRAVREPRRRRPSTAARR